MAQNKIYGVSENKSFVEVPTKEQYDSNNDNINDSLDELNLISLKWYYPTWNYNNTFTPTGDFSINKVLAATFKNCIVTKTSNTETSVLTFSKSNTNENISITITPQEDGTFKASYTHTINGLTPRENETSSIGFIYLSYL